MRVGQLPTLGSGFAHTLNWTTSPALERGDGGLEIVGGVNVALRRGRLLQNDVALKETAERGAPAADGADVQPRSILLPAAGSPAGSPAGIASTVMPSLSFCLPVDAVGRTGAGVLFVVRGDLRIRRRLGELDLEVLLLAVADDLEIDDVARLVAADDALERAHLVHGLAVGRNDHVAGRGCRPSRRGCPSAG